MNAPLQILNPLTRADWDEELLANRGYSFFHTAAWARVLVDSYRFTPYYFTLIENRVMQVLVPLMEAKSIFTGKKGVALPFTDNSSPLVADSISCGDVYGQITEFGKQAGWKYLEIKGGCRDPGQTPSTSYYDHLLTLAPDENQLYRNFNNGTKGNIKKAVKEGVSVSISRSAAAMQEFYRLNSLTRRRHGLPSQPLMFFKAIFTHILEAGKGFIVLASYGGKYVAGAVFFHFGVKALYKYAASDERFQHLRPNNLVMWEAIQWLCRNGFNVLDMGRTEDYNEGLRHYKAGWGATEEVLNYYKYDYARGAFVREKNQAPGFYTVLLRKLPVPVLNIMGSLAYKHIA
ncbi:MAG: GNAT family N-acetyltransferase [Chitinivibrionales bacterium]|nr:GNAT family N-acetyltransferase [Chitinivibrionales bacterium]